MASPMPRRRFTTDEYARMIEAGILDKDDRVELIEGEIVTMTPINPPHTACVMRLNVLFAPAAVQGRLVLNIQGQVRLPEFSQPQPDVALLVPPLSRYARRHAGPDDILLLIEVGDTTAAADRAVKIPLYAQAGVREAWLVDVNAGVVEVSRLPSPTGYREVTRAGRGQSLSPLAVPEVSLSVDEILG